MKKWIAAMLALTCILGSASAYTYERITLDEINAPSDWAKEEVLEARDSGLLTEHTSNYFKMYVTRSQFAELSVNLLEKLTGQEITPAPDTTFTDCTESSALKAYAAGITTGTGDGATFSPEDNITREQIAVMLMRAMAAAEQATGKTPLTGSGDLSAFTDSAFVSTWAVDGVAALHASGILKGTSTSTLSPQGTTTIQEAVILILRLYQADQQ